MQYAISKIFDKVVIFLWWRRCELGVKLLIYLSANLRRTEEYTFSDTTVASFMIGRTPAEPGRLTKTIHRSCLNFLRWVQWKARQNLLRFTTQSIQWSSNYICVRMLNSYVIWVWHGCAAHCTLLPSLCRFRRKLVTYNAGHYKRSMVHPAWTRVAIALENGSQIRTIS